MRLTRSVRQAILAILILAPGAYAQRGIASNAPQRTIPYSLRVGVREEGTEQPIADANVQVRGSRGGVATDTSSGAGECYFSSLPGDQYQIFVTAQGYESASGSVDLLNDSVIVLRLRKQLSPDSPVGSMVSVRILKLPEKAREAYEHGWKELYAKHNPAKSVPYFRATLAEAHDCYEAHHQIGVALEEMGHAQEAESEYREAIRMSDGQFGPSQFSLAALLSGRKEFVPAEAAARKGLESSPQSGLGHYELARALLGQGKWDAAEEEANTTLGVARKLPKAYLILAAIHDQRHEPGKVFHDLTEYLKLVPTGPTSDRMRQRLEEVRQEMEKKDAAARTPATSPPSP
jgi:tetratricopeptide (TPR) repeat protein